MPSWKLMPDISAILPTRDRAHSLPFVLEGLRRQSLSKRDFEIVAIDDGSTDTTQDILNAASSDLPIRVFRQRHSGLAAAKTLGLFASSSPILLFIGDDDVAEPDLLLAHLETHRKHPAESIAVLGNTTLAAEIARNPVMHHVTQVGGQLFSYGSIKPGTVLDYTAFWGGRSSCKRALLLHHGVFNPLFTFGYEDIELGWRLAQRAGLRVLYEPAARCVMIRELSFGEFCARQERMGMSQWLFAQMHPTEPIMRYCQINAGLQTWKAYAERYFHFMRWVETLDRMAQVRAKADVPLDSRSQRTLDAAYSMAFRFSRAKGIASGL